MHIHLEDGKLPYLNFSNYNEMGKPCLNRENRSKTKSLALITRITHYSHRKKFLIVTDNLKQIPLNGKVY